MTGGQSGAVVTFIPRDTNTTFKNDTATPGFKNVYAGADIVGVVNKPLTYRFDGTTGDWLQMAAY